MTGRTRRVGASLFLGALLLAAIAPAAFGQDSTEAPPPRPDAKKVFSWGILPVYSETYKLGFAVPLLATFPMDPADTVSQRSALQVLPLLSFNVSWAMPTFLDIFYKEDSWRYTQELTMRAIRDAQYWGIGYDMAQDPDLEEYYDQTEFIFRPVLYKKMAKWAYFGAIYSLHTTSAQNTQKNGLLRNPKTNPWGNDIKESGFGVALMYDGRDIFNNAFRGLYLNVSGTFYREWLGSDYEFNEWIVDYRQFVKVSDTADRILAWQAFGRYAEGDTPWTDMSLLGGPWGMRAYNPGRYRDRLKLVGQVEYRMLRLRGKNGAAVWVAAGTVADKPKDVRWDEVLPEIGIGWRYETQPRWNLRFDLGFGKDSVELWAYLGEAF